MIPAMPRVPGLAALILLLATACGGGSTAAPAATVTVTAPADSALASSPDESSQPTPSPILLEGPITTSRSHTFPSGRRADFVDVVRTPRSAYPADTQPAGTTVLTVRVRYTQLSAGPTNGYFTGDLASGASRLTADQQQVVGGNGIERWQSTDPDRLAVGDRYLDSSTFAVPTDRMSQLSLQVSSGVGETTADDWTFTGLEAALN